METLYRFDLLPDGRIIKNVIRSFDITVEERKWSAQRLRTYYSYKDKGVKKYVYEDKLDKFDHNRVYTFKDDIKYVRNIIKYTLNDKIIFYDTQKEKMENLLTLMIGAKDET